MVAATVHVYWSLDRGGTDASPMDRTATVLPLAVAPAVQLPPPGPSSWRRFPARPDSFTAWTFAPGCPCRHEGFPREARSKSWDQNAL